MKREGKRPPIVPRPSVPDPRRHLLRAVLAFVGAASSLPGVRRIALVGYLATDKAVPKDADVLVMHLVLSPLAVATQQGLHAAPRTVGEVATSAARNAGLIG